jgi:hypothetical protein
MLFEEFIEGGNPHRPGRRPRLAGEGWLKSIHVPDAFKPIDPELLHDARRLGHHFGLLHDAVVICLPSRFFHVRRAEPLDPAFY